MNYQQLNSQQQPAPRQIPTYASYRPASNTSGTSSPNVFEKNSNLMGQLSLSGSASPLNSASPMLRSANSNSHSNSSSPPIGSSSISKPFVNVVHLQVSHVALLFGPKSSMLFYLLSPSHPEHPLRTQPTRTKTYPMERNTFTFVMISMIS
eukprot:gene2623-3015_t